MESIILYISVLLGSGITMMFLTYSVFWLFRRFGIVDKPHLYPHEEGRDPLPYPGGIVLILNLLLESVDSPICCWGWYQKNNLCYHSRGHHEFAYGVGRSEANSEADFPTLFQLVLWAFFFGLTAIKIGYVSNIFGGIISLDTFEVLQWTFGDKTIYFIPLMATIIWYVLVMNAINWSDNGRAMTSSVSLVTLIILAGLSIKLYLIDTTIASQNNSIFVLSFLTILIPTPFCLLALWCATIMHSGRCGDYVFGLYDSHACYCFWRQDSDSLYCFGDLFYRCFLCHTRTDTSW